MYTHSYIAHSYCKPYSLSHIAVEMLKPWSLSHVAVEILKYKTWSLTYCCRNAKIQNLLTLMLL